MFDDLFQLISCSFLVGVFVPAGGWALSSLVNIVRVALRYV